jgi:hypothetical protein
MVFANFFLKSSNKQMPNRKKQLDVNSVYMNLIPAEIVDQIIMYAQCQADEIRNPASGRCVKRNGSIGRRLVDCPAGKIRSPENRRCIKIGGNAYKRAFGVNAVCADPAKIRNPVTGRCITANGSVHRKLQQRNGTLPDDPCKPGKIRSPLTRRCVSPKRAAEDALIASGRGDRYNLRRSA